MSRYSLAIRHVLPALPFTVLEHYKRFGRLSLFRDPKTFTELILAKKLYDKNPIYTQTSDKFAVREFVAERIGTAHLIPLYQVAESFAELRFADFPDSFVLKATHGCDMILIVRRKDQIDLIAAERETHKWLRRNYYHNFKEWAYQGVAPRLIVEELLLDGGQPPPDYKLWVFRGSVRLIQVDVGRFGLHGRAFFDEGWRRLRVTEKYGPVDRDMPRPDSLGEMLRIAQTLSKDFDFARVDLYDHKGRVYFGEITHYPGAGTNRFEPMEFDRALGDLWRLNQPIPKRFYLA